MRGLNQPCIECGVLTRKGNRCELHQQLRNQAHDQKRAATKKATGQYAGKYRAKAKQVRETAVACWICGEGYRPDDPWQADHVNPGEHGDKAVLLPAHASCNQSRGSKPIFGSKPL